MRQLGLEIQHFLRLIQLNLVERRNLMVLLRGNPPEARTSPLQPWLPFA